MRNFTFSIGARANTVSHYYAFPIFTKLEPSQLKLHNTKSVAGDPQRGREKSSESSDRSRLAPGAELSLPAPQISSGWDWFTFKRCSTSWKGKGFLQFGCGSITNATFCHQIIMKMFGRFLPFHNGFKIVKLVVWLHYVLRERSIDSLNYKVKFLLNVTSRDLFITTCLALSGCQSCTAKIGKIRTWKNIFGKGWTKWKLEICSRTSDNSLLY